MGTQRRYKPGDYYMICDRTGFATRSSRVRKQWNNLQVREKSWEPRNAQDFVRGVADLQNVPVPRPRPVNQFLGPLTTFIAAAALAGDTQIEVESSVRFGIGDNVQIMLNTGTFQTVTLTNVASVTTMQFLTPLTAGASVGNVVIDTSAVVSPTVDAIPPSQ